MGLVTSLFVNLGLRHENFIANIRESKEAAEGFRESVHSNFGAAQGYLEAFFIIDVAEKFREGLEKAIEYGAQLNALADRAGVTTEAFQGLRFAAGESGVSAETFQGAMQKLTRTLGDAKTGSDKAIEAFKGIGVSGKELAELSPEEALKKLADAASKIEDPARRAHLEIEFLGKKGQESDPLLRQGAAAIEEMADKAREFGLNLSQGQADKLKEIANAGHLVGEAIDAGLAKGFADNADGLIKIAEAAARAAAGFSKLGEVIGGYQAMAERNGKFAAFFTLPTVAASLGTPEGRLAYDQRHLADAQGDVDRGGGFFSGLFGNDDASRRAERDRQQNFVSGDIISSVGGLKPLRKEDAPEPSDAGGEDRTAKATKAASAYDNALASLNKTSGELAVRLKAVGDNLPTEEVALLTRRADEYALAEKSGGTPEHIANLKRVADANYAAGEALREKTRRQEEANAVGEEAAKITRTLYTDVDKYADKVLADAAKLTDLTADVFGKAMQASIAHLNDAEKKTLEIGRTFFGDLSQGLGEVATGSARIGDVLVDSFKRAAAALITSKIFDLIGGIGLGGGSTIGKLFNFAGGRAEGGPVEAGRTYLVGENGPELRSDLGSGQIIPNHALKSMMAGSGPQSVAVSVDVNPSPLFTTVVGTAVQAGVAQSEDAQRRARRTPLARGRG